MKPLAPPYHHGNLRAALIDAGLALIQEKGVRALTLREIGARVGVSRMAAYRHFSDKADLLGAIREAGFAQFASALDTARRKARGKGFWPQLAAMALAYVRFAADHQAHYEVMFGPNGYREENPPAPSGARAFAILDETIRLGQEAGEIRPGDSIALARMVWALVHGLSTLPTDPHTVSKGADAKFVSFCSEVLKDGLAAR